MENTAEVGASFFLRALPHFIAFNGTFFHNQSQSAVDGSDGLTVSCDVDSDAQGRGALYTARITVSDDSGEVYALDASRYESGVR